MLLTIDGKVKIMFPDNAYMLYTESGTGIPSVELNPGVRLTIVGAPAHERLQKSLFTDEGKQSFGPYRYGRPDLEYATFQELNK
ncbi:hypothetical protein SDC9_212312 [bioreactor metagenome]|uniref:S-Me-THD-like C-terminal domain-containing protein n=1 Tax=bioreactor metagenome TaxID=1076179 RepID=A0A645JMH1_9ZZZZ